MYCIYEIKIDDYTYIGSTKNFKERIRYHKKSYKFKKHKVYRKIRELGGFKKCEINIVEDNISKEEKLSIERFYVESLNPNYRLNKELPGRTELEWRKTSVKGKVYNNLRNIRRNKKKPCPKCGKIMNGCSITRHLKKSCPKNND